MVSLEARMYAKTKSTLSRNMMLGVGFCVVAVICHLAKLAISKWFNHLDLSHVFMGIAMYVMYMGVRKEQQQKPLNA